MDKFFTWFTKKKLFTISLVSLIGFFVLVPREVLWKVCSTGNDVCIDFFNYLLLILMIGTTLLIPILILYFLRQNVFESWKKTLFIYLFIYLLNLIFMPWYFGDEFLHLQKDLVALFISVLYLVFSLIFITYKSLKK